MAVKTNVFRKADSLIKKRLKECLHFYILFYRDNLEKEENIISFYGLPTCLKWYAGGIYMVKENELAENWFDCFYNKAQAMKANQAMESILRKKYIWSKENSSWVKKNLLVLEQIYAKIIVESIFFCYNNYMNDHLALFNPDKSVDSYADALYAYALARVNDMQPAEDIVQDTFLSAWKARDSYNRAASEKNWLYAIVKNKIMDHFRKRVTGPLSCWRGRRTIILKMPDTGLGKQPQKIGLQIQSSRWKTRIYTLLEKCKQKTKRYTAGSICDEVHGRSGIRRNL